MNDLIKELKEKEVEVSAEEVKIKKRHVEIAKRQDLVMRLNRQLAACRKDSDGNENAGPLENQRNNIVKQIKECEDEITHIQKQWIENQIKLIQDQKDFQEI